MQMKGSGAAAGGSNVGSSTSGTGGAGMSLRSRNDALSAMRAVLALIDERASGKQSRLVRCCCCCSLMILLAAVIGLDSFLVYCCLCLLRARRYLRMRV